MVSRDCLVIDLDPLKGSDVLVANIRSVHPVDVVTHRCRVGPHRLGKLIRVFTSAHTTYGLLHLD